MARRVLVYKKTGSKKSDDMIVPCRRQMAIFPESCNFVVSCRHVGIISTKIPSKVPPHTFAEGAGRGGVEEEEVRPALA